jgi:hypothetical protein
MKTKNGSEVLGFGGSISFNSRDPEAFVMKVRLDSGPHEEGKLVTLMEAGCLNENIYKLYTTT